MQASICHYSFHRRWAAENWTCDRLAAEVKALGVPAVDFHVRYLGDPKTAPALIKDALDKHGLQLSGLSMSNDFNQDDAESMKAQVDAVKTWLPVAAAVGAPASRIFGGHLAPADRPDEQKKQAANQRVMDALGQVVDEARRLGVVLALENHGGLPCTGEEQVAIIEAINSPHLRATIDVGNYLQGCQESYDGTRAAVKYAAYVHLKDFKKGPANAYGGWELEPCIVGQGDVDQAACLEIMRQNGYQGFVALEYEGTEGEETGVPESVKFMKTLIG